MKKNKTNYFQSHWMGQYSLKVSFWLNTVFFNFILLLLFSALLAVYALNDKQSAYRLLLNYNLISFFVAIWQGVGIHRSSRHYIEKGGFPFWSMLARTLILLYIARIVISIILLLFFPESILPTISKQLDDIVRIQSN